jgi:Protein of unknown function (DUF1631)
MNPIDSRSRAALDAALGHVAATGAAVVTRVGDLLGGLTTKATSSADRDACNAARIRLRQQAPAFERAFDEALRAGLRPASAQQRESTRGSAPSRWESLTLVDDTEVEGRMIADRIGETIAHECEVELRELAAYTGTLVGIRRTDADRDPLGPEALGAALFKGIEAVTPDFEMRKLLARELGPVAGQAMRSCLAEIVADLKVRGIQPTQLSIRGVDGPGNDRVTSGYAGLPSIDSQSGSLGTVVSTAGGALGGIDSGRGGPVSSSRGSSLRGASPRGATASGQAIADAELMGLIRRLTAIDSHHSHPDEGAAGPAGRGVPSDARSGASDTDVGRLRGDGLTGLMAVNLIRAHREELRQASTGMLDHMVIEVVGSLFDQILSDPRVSPQMARQIARLQLPVLRVALADTSFFSSRKHPVRRFVNRIASLACAFDDFDDGPGKQFLDRVRDLVQEIIDGDFDQVEVYAAKLTMLEAFIEQQNEGAVEAHGAAATLLNGREAELRVQQAYMQQLQVALASVPMEDYLRDFLTQVWSQAIALGTRRDGPQAERTLRLRKAAIELVLSVQPKGTPQARKMFLMQLPGLMKSLNEGMASIGWPEPAQREFFGRLLPAHAESLKLPALSDLDRNLLAKQVEAAFNIPLPRSETIIRGPIAEETIAGTVAPIFSAEEAQRVGFVAENAVDWAAPVDIEIDLEPAEPEPDAKPEPLDLGVDIDLSVVGPTEPVQGPDLMHSLQVGCAYKMHIKDRWQKVRLSYVSSGRSFFAFTHGRRHQETISFTARMLARLCESGRLRAYESSYLLERATARARKQLAELKPAAAVAGKALH